VGDSLSVEPEIVNKLTKCQCQRKTLSGKTVYC